MTSHLDFGYPWWLTYGALVITAVALPLWLLGYARKWSKVLLVPIGAVTLWSIAAFVVARFVLNVNGKTSLPTQQFLSSGSGRVLDMGAGTGRSSIMVLEARPQTTVVALDLFEQSFKEHFGNVSGQEKLLANFKAVGVENRTSIQAGDMRKLPFDAASFDGIVSSFAVDHLRREGVNQSLHEAARVLKPGGEFLLMLIGKDFWLALGFGPMFLHFPARGPEWWTEQLQDSGFHVVEQGTRPGMLYFLSRKG